MVSQIASDVRQGLDFTITVQPAAKFDSETLLIRILCCGPVTKAQQAEVFLRK